MSFLYPAFLIGALAAAIPIVLHLLRRDVAPEVPFTAVRLLRRSPLEQTRRRRLRDLLLLAARVAALMLLAAAFARPYLTAAAGGPALEIIAIDRSYSMAAPGQFERAQAEARSAIAAAGRGRRIAVIAFDDRAAVVAVPGGPGEARAAVDALRPTYGSTRFAPVFERAIELSDRDEARLVIVSDLQRGGWESAAPATVPSSLQVEVRRVDAPAGNLAVTRLRRDADSIRMEIRNAGAAAVSGTARLAVDNRPAATAPFAVPASSSADVIVPYRAPARGILSAEIDEPSGFPFDNRRFLLLDPTGRPHVTIVADAANQSGFYATRVLQSADGETGFDVQTASAAALGTVDPEQLAQQSVLMLLSTRNLDRRGRERLVTFVRQGGGLLIAASADIDPSAVAAAMSWPDFSAIEQAAAARCWRRPIFAIRSSGRLAGWRRTWVRCDSPAPGRCGRTDGTSRPGGPTDLRRCSSAAKAMAGWCCSRRTSIGGGTTFR